MLASFTHYNEEIQIDKLSSEESEVHHTKLIPPVERVIAYAVHALVSKFQFLTVH